MLANLRAPDHEEVVASTGREPLALLKHLPFNTRVALLKDKPVALFGIGRDAEGTHPWLLCTDDIRGKGLGRFMVNYGRNQMYRWARMHGPLTNVVYTKNHAHLRFVQALGCTLGETRKRGPLLQHFTEFSYVPTRTRGSTRRPG